MNDDYINYKRLKMLAEESRRFPYCIPFNVFDFNSGKTMFIHQFFISDLKLIT